MFKNDLLKIKGYLLLERNWPWKRDATHYAEHGADIFICGRRENVLKDTAA